MGIFGNKEEKEQVKKDTRLSIFENDREMIENTNGKYFARMFSASEFAKTNATATIKLYKEIADYANYFNLEIKNISRLNDDALKLVGISVMFEKE